MNHRYARIEELFLLMDPQHGTPCLSLYLDHRSEVAHLPGTRTRNHPWSGGGIDLLIEAMNIAQLQYTVLRLARPLPFSLADALLVLFLNSMERLLRTARGADQPLRYGSIFSSRTSVSILTRDKLALCGIKLTSAQEQAFQHLTTETVEYGETRYAVDSLAAFCHAVVLLCVSVWPDHPFEQDDPWMGARRRDA